MSLPRKIMEQFRLCPAKLWSNADFAPQNKGVFILCLAKSQSLYTLPCKIIKQCRLCPAKQMSLHTLPREITDPLYFAPRNYKAMQTLPYKSTET